MIVEPLPGAIAGIVAGGAMLALELVRRVTDRGGGRERAEFDILAIWSSLLGIPGDEGRIVALVIHFLVSAAVGLLYAIGFALAGVRDAAPLWGILGGTLHWLVAGAFLGLVPGGNRSAGPGPFANRLGPDDTIVFLGAHLVYGFVFGTVYVLFGGLSPA